MPKIAPLPDTGEEDFKKPIKQEDRDAETIAVRNRFNRLEVKFMKRVQIVTTLFQIATGCTLPVVDFVLGYNGSGDPRTLYMPLLFWICSCVIGILGLVGAFSHHSWVLALYLIVGLGCLGALPSFSAAQYGILSSECSIVQAAFKGCDDCLCAIADTCSLSDLGKGTCKDCKAWPKKLCDYFDHGAITSAVFAICIFVGLVPALTCGFLLFIRKEVELNNDRYMLDYTESQIRMQLSRMLNAEAPTCPFDMLERLIERLDRVGMKSLATQTRVAMQMFRANEMRQRTHSKAELAMAMGATNGGANGATGYHGPPQQAPLQDGYGGGYAQGEGAYGQEGYAEDPNAVYAYDQGQGGYDPTQQGGGYAANYT